MYVYVQRQRLLQDKEFTVRDFFSWTMSFSKSGRLVEFAIQPADEASLRELSHEHLYVSDRKSVV